MAMDEHPAPRTAHSPGPPGPGGSPDDAVRGLAGRLRELRPSCGPVRLVGVDGHAGSGKTTFSGALSDALGGAPVVHLDDVASHEELFAWTSRLRTTVLEPLGRGADGWLPVYDWTACRFGRTVRVPCEPVVLVEGVGAGRAALRPHLAELLWMDTDRETSWARGRRRDGAGLDDFWRRWLRAENVHFAADPSRPHADRLVREVPDGYEVLTGPAGRS